MNPLQAAINNYHRLGLACIPLRHRDKRPAVAWDTYQRQRPTVSDLRQWFGQDGNRNVGLVCGAVSGGLVVLDFDNRMALENFLDACPSLKERTPIVSTARGGHVWLRTPAPVRALKLEEFGLDVLGEGHYVVAPPSVHPTGHVYTFRNGNSGIMEIADLTAWLSAILSRLGVTLPTEGRPDTPGGAGDGPTTSGQGERWLAEVLTGPPLLEGTRNASLTSLAGYLRNHHPQDVTAHLLSAVNASRCSPLLPDAEVQDIVHSVYRYPAHTPHEGGNLTSDHKGRALEVRLEEMTGAEVLTWAESTPPLEYLPLLGQERLIVKGWSHILAAYPKAGKTELLADAAIRWAKQGLRVLYFTEEPKSIWAQRLRQRGADAPLNRLSLVFALGAGVDAVTARIEVGPEDIAIIDTTRNVLGTADETDNSLVAQAMMAPIKAARSTDKTLIFLHHERKGGGQHGEGIAGGHAFLGIVDVGLELVRDNPNTPNRRLLKGQARVVTVPELLYEMADDGSFVALGQPSAVALDETKTRVVKTLDGDRQPTKAIWEGLRDPQPSQDQVSKALEALGQEGKVERDPPIADGSKPGKTYRWRLSNLTSNGPSYTSEDRLEAGQEAAGGGQRP